MKRNVKVWSVLSACVLLAWGNAVPALAEVKIREPFMELTIEEDAWTEISDQETVHTFTNGQDVIQVLRYYTGGKLPEFGKIEDGYEAVYQTVYTAGNEIYVVLGAARSAKDIAQVKEIMDEISYPDASDSQGQTAAPGASDSQGQAAAPGTSDSKTQTNAQAAPGASDLQEQTNTQAAPGASDSQTQKETEASFGNGESEVNDPYELYSWDAGTNSYIPFQQAEGNGAPIGRGNGWYYYDAESGNYLPW